MKPRIVILSAFLTPFRSGAEACAEEVAIQLADQFDITIVTARLRKDLLETDTLEGRVKVIRVGKGDMFDKWRYPFLAPKEAKKHNPQVIHAILETFAGEALLRCKKIIPNAKRILTMQTDNRKFRKKKIIQSPDVVTAISKHLQGIAENLGRKDVVVIPNGIDYAAIRSACEKYKKVPGRIVFVGRLEKMKGVDLLLNAFAELPISGVHLHIVGDGSQREALKKQTLDLGIANRVTFKGYVPAPDVYKEYAEAEIFCGLSRSEALGNVFLEALAAGCAILSTNVGGIVEIVHEGAASVLVRPEAPSIAKALAKMTSIDLGTAFAAENQAFASHYDWKLIANKYAQFYKSVTLP